MHSDREQRRHLIDAHGYDEASVDSLGWLDVSYVHHLDHEVLVDPHV